MLTIPNAVEEVIKKKPFLEGALVEGLINLSALARQLKPEIEKKVGKEVNDSAVIMALNRLVPRLELMSAMKFKKVVENIGDIIVRSNLADYAFVNSPTLYERQAMLLDRVRTMKDVFCTFSQGIYETTLVVSSTIVGLVDEIFADENNIAKTVDLSSIPSNCPPRIRSVRASTITFSRNWRGITSISPRSSARPTNLPSLSATATFTALSRF